MQLEVYFMLDQKKLPRDYTSIFYSFLKQALVRNNEELYTKLFDKYKVKKFCFSLRLPDPVFTKDFINLAQNEVIMTIRDYDLVELFEFYNVFLADFKNNTTYPMNCNQAKIAKIQISKTKTVVSDSLLIKMNSPLTLKLHNQETNKDWYYTYLDDQFLDILKDNIHTITQRLGYTFDLNNFDLQPIDPKKTVISMYGISFPVSLGSFILKGNKDLLNFLYQAGIGSLRSSGCGQFEIIRKE